MPSHLTQKDPSRSHPLPPFLLLCIGNRYTPTDNLGPRLFDLLTSSFVFDPLSLEVIDGGLLGLNLLGLLEGRQRVVFVDNIEDPEDPQKILVLDREALSPEAEHFGHSAGIPYLVAAAELLERPPAEIYLVGAGGPLAPSRLHLLAQTCLEIATYGSA